MLCLPRLRPYAEAFICFGMPRWNIGQIRTNNANLPWKRQRSQISPVGNALRWGEGWNWKYHSGIPESDLIVFWMRCYDSSRLDPSDSLNHYYLSKTKVPKLCGKESPRNITAAFFVVSCAWTDAQIPVKMLQTPCDEASLKRSAFYRGIESIQSEMSILIILEEIVLFARSLHTCRLPPTVSLRRC